MQPSRDKSDWLNKPHMPVTYAKHYLERARERGVPPERVLDAAGLKSAMLADPAARLTPLEFTQLVATVLQLAGDEGVGFEVGAQQPLTAHGSLGYLLMCCETVDQAARMLQRFWLLRGRGIGLNYREQGDRLVFEFHSELPMPDPLLQTMYQSILTSCYRGLLFLLGGVDPQAEFRFTLPAPPYFERFRQRLPTVRFEMTTTQLSIPAAFRDHRLEMSSPDARALAVAQCERELALLGVGEAGDDVLSQVRAAMLLGPGGYPDPDALAARLHLSPRTLRRRLQAQGGSYQRLLEDVRRRDAVQLLENPGLEIQRVAELLGYADPANFTRAFRQWTGKTPSQFRAMRLG